MNSLTDETFLKAIQSGPCLVKFSAPWCQPCKTLTPILQSVEEKIQIPIFEINVDENPETAQTLGIRALPTVMAFNAGLMIGVPLVGSRPAEAYIALAGEAKSRQ